MVLLIKIACKHAQVGRYSRVAYLHKMSKVGTRHL